MARIPTRLPSLRRPPIGFAHHGARAHSPENTLEAFKLALRLGATGLESDVWVTADGEAVLDHDGLVGRWARRRRTGELTRKELPAHVPTLDELYAGCGTDIEVSLEVKEPARCPAWWQWLTAGGDAPAACGCATRTGGEWRRWRRTVPDVRLVDSTRFDRVEEGLERRAAISRRRRCRRHQPPPQ